VGERKWNNECETGKKSKYVKDVLKMQIDNKKAIFGWSMYDWANSAFATTIMAGFFPIFFKQYWSAGVDATVSTARLGMANSIECNQNRT